MTPILTILLIPLESATCCTQKWMPSDGMWGCCPYPNAVCCSNGYNCCPAGTKCQDIRGKQGLVVLETNALKVQT